MYGIYDGNAVIAEFVTPMTVKSVRPTFHTDPLSLKRNVSSRPAQRWEIETKLVPQVSTADDLFVNMITKGHFGKVQVVMPQIYSSRFVTDRSPGTGNIVGTATKGATSVQITSTGRIPKGLFIKFSNHDKIYAVTEQLIGSGNLQIYPGLVSTVTGGTVNVSDLVIGQFYYDLDTTTGMVYVDGIQMDNGTIKLVEAL